MARRPAGIGLNSISIHILAVILSGHAIAAEAPSRLPAPTNQTELEARIATLRKHYAPFLRTLPEAKSLRQRHSLNGSWLSRYEVDYRSDQVDGKYITLDKPPEAPFAGVAYDDKHWEATQVPEWRLPRKGRTDILWYRKHFTFTATEPGKRTFLVFDAADWFADVWLNGQHLGSHSGYHLGFRFDVSDLVKADNVLAVRLLNGRRYGEPQAFWSLMPSIKCDAGRYVKGTEPRLVDYGSGLGYDGHGIHGEDGNDLGSGSCPVDVPATAALKVKAIVLPEQAPSVVNLQLILKDSSDREISRYQRDIYIGGS